MNKKILSSTEQKAKDLARQGDYVSALMIHRELCKELPERADLHLNTGILCIQCNRYLEAESYLKRSLEIQPDIMPAHYYLGDLYIHTRNYHNAITHLTRAAEIQPGNSQPQIRLGDAFFLTGRLAEAERHYYSSLEDPQVNPIIYFKIGAVADAAGKFEESIKYYSKYTSKVPHDYEGFNNLGLVFSKCGKFRKAINCFKQSLALKPQQPTIAFNTGVGLQALNNEDEACDYYRRAIQISPRHAQAHANLGYLLHSIGKHEEALVSMKTAARILPDDPQVQHMLASIGGTETPATASPDYVRQTFDNYASRFDQHLTSKLHYKIPELLLSCFLEIFPQPSTNLNILDLGCGTGLCGQLLKPYATRLIGVDLSPKMLEEATKKGVYDVLVTADIQDYLNATTDIFDAIFAADVFVYIGNLERIFSECSTHLPMNGLFAFSVEDEPDIGKTYILRPTGRYAHSRNYIETLCRVANFRVIIARTEVLRLQDEKPVNGCLFILKKT